MGSFDVRFRSCQDRDFFLRVTHSSKVDYVDEVLTQYRWHGENYSGNALRRLTESILLLGELPSKISLDRREKKLLRKRKDHTHLKLFILLYGTHKLRALKHLALAIRSYPFDLYLYASALKTILPDSLYKKLSAAVKFLLGRSDQGD